jgi:hypothetical protein
MVRAHWVVRDCEAHTLWHELSESRRRDHTGYAAAGEQIINRCSGDKRHEDVIHRREDLGDEGETARTHNLQSDIDKL